MKRTLGFGVASVLVMSLLIAGNTASATSTLTTTRWVNDNDPDLGFYSPPGTSCNHPGYQTIQSAVNAAGPGDRINVCPGTYPEQVVIAGPTKNDISLRSVEVWQAIIKAPAVPIPAGFVPTTSIVRVDGAQRVQILAFTITGPGPAGCNSLNWGVRVEGGGSADIFGNHIAHVRDNPFSGCQNGVAVQVGRMFEMTTGSARIIGNVIDGYQKNGITVDNAGSYAEVAYNLIIGAGPTIVIAQNGAQVSRGATANIRNNFVSGNDYTGPSAVATGVLLFQPGVVAVDRNTVNLNGVGIFDITAGAGTAVKNNAVRASTFDGIALQDLSDQRVETNKVSDNAGPGIALYGALQNAIKSNWVTSNRDTGILLDSNGPTFGSNENSVRYNVVTYNGTAGSVPDTTTIDRNRLKNNITHDCHDGSTGNTWTNNEGQTSFPPDLCQEDAHADEDSDNSHHGWDRHYKWNAEFGVPADMDFLTAYDATVDIDALIRSLPPLPVNLGLQLHPTSPSN
jgi:parallel beta-helix repeat protein